MTAETSSNAVINANGLCLTFDSSDGPVHALKDVDLQIDKGDFVSFIGPSGCGKTTLLRVIADLEHPTRGSISVNGMTPEQARLERAYGYVFQAPALLAWRSIERNVGLPLEIMGISAAEKAERVARTLELVGLDGFGRKFPWQLSGGMQQRASIARALAFDADCGPVFRRVVCRWWQRIIARSQQNRSAMVSVTSPRSRTGPAVLRTECPFCGRMAWRRAV